MNKQCAKDKCKELEGWELILLDARVNLTEAKGRVKQLRGVIREIEEKIKRGELFPGTTGKIGPTQN